MHPWLCIPVSRMPGGAGTRRGLFLVHSRCQGSMRPWPGGRRCRAKFPGLVKGIFSVGRECKGWNLGSWCSPTAFLDCCLTVIIGHLRRFSLAGCWLRRWLSRGACFPGSWWGWSGVGRALGACAVDGLAALGMDTAAGQGDNLGCHEECTLETYALVLPGPGRGGGRDALGR